MCESATKLACARRVLTVLTHHCPLTTAHLWCAAFRDDLERIKASLGLPTRYTALWARRATPTPNRSGGTLAPSLSEPGIGAQLAPFQPGQAVRAFYDLSTTLLAA